MNVIFNLSAASYLFHSVNYNIISIKIDTMYKNIQSDCEGSVLPFNISFFNVGLVCRIKMILLLVI